jgi:hypothetical protein
MSGIRREPIYLRTEVWHAVELISQARTRRLASGFVTTEDVAESLLCEVIASKFPQLLEYQRELNELEAKFIATLEEEK